MSGNRVVSETCACGGVIAFVFEAGRVQLPEAIRVHQNTGRHEGWWRAQFHVCPSCQMVRVPPTRELCNFCRKAPTEPLTVQRMRELWITPATATQFVDATARVEA